MSNSVAGAPVPEAHSDLQVRQRALAARLARAWAREEGELQLFDADRPASPDRAGGEVYESYMSDAWDLLRGSGLADLLVLSEILSRNAPRHRADADDLDAVEGLIAQETIEHERIASHLEQWRAGKIPGRDERWAENAKRALNAKTTNIRAARKLRLRLARDELMAEVIAGRDAQIADLLSQNRVEKGRRSQQTERSDASLRAARDYIAEHAPHLLNGMQQHVNAAEEAFDRAAIAKAEEREPAELPQTQDETADITP